MSTQAETFGPFSADEKYRAAMREVGQRRKVYRRLVYLERMSQGDADREIAIMMEIATDYRRQACEDQGTMI